ncbi:hypothetical protein EV663_11116 [Rhodovulum bhavnagarense]|uniref:Sulfotransferase domain-containing protein n=1 Tax=Rhodovulum bhavnagarense TaxID=992286 RepID=A0A4R2RAC7_9RHOB|nr:hypothetical protein [Rhodovulum bhavnagarense]TCP60230.1 hypothetical protein EV663_11116 [Rhodovulum bhavnagarense]
MTRRIILHIGSPKCGSTYLQKVLSQNAEALGSVGIRYPAPAATHPGNAGDLQTITRERLESYFAGGIETVVLSHEDLYSLPGRGDALAALAAEDGAEVQIVAFLRPFSEFLYGDYSQFMKQHFEQFLATRNPYDGRSFREFCERRVKTLNPAQFLRNWQKRFPSVPLALDSHRAIRPVLERLLGEIPAMDWTVRRHETNPSLRMEDCDRIVAAMRDLDRNAKDIRDMFRTAFHMTAEPDAGKTEARTAWIEAAFARQNAAILDEFGYDNRLARQAREKCG